MCGIVLVASGPAEIPAGSVEAMTARLKHRGPDAQACVTLPGCHLGHTRLSVIDLSTGDQPMTEETRRYWIVFNGEIYNYRELRRELEGHGWQFRTQSDTEVLLRAYQQFGDEAPQRLNGQFAFAIWDSRERRVFAARDRLGEKPFYWAVSEQGHFMAASEIKALLAAPSGLLRPRLDRVSVEAYLALLYVPPDRTIYQNVHTLRPGHAMIWQGARCRDWAYWTPAYSRRPVTDPREAIQHVGTLVSQAVRRQMVADVPVGAFLSGGLDSSTIVALMTEHTQTPVMTFSVGFGKLIDELPYARAVAEAYRTDHHEIQMDIPVGEILERMSEVYDEPFADSSNIPTYLIAEFARRDVKVVLSGDGGDELFGGYEWYQPLLAGLDLKPTAANLAWLQGLAFAWRVLAKAGAPVRSQRDAAIQRHAAVGARLAYPDVWDRHIAFVTGLKDDRVGLSSVEALRQAESEVRRLYGPTPGLEEMDRATDFDVRCYLPGDILVKVDRAAMAHGLETRAPFLDVDLVEYVLGLAWQLRFRGSTSKYLLREACGRLWPQLVRARGKQGFGAPIWMWLQRPDVRSLIERVSRPGSPLLTPLPGLASAWPRLSHQQRWTVLCLGLWLERRTECLSCLS